MRISYRRLPFLAFSFLAAMVFSASASADEYIIGPEDVLQISFWQEPTLDQTVMVRQDGKITLSIIGEITAAGLTSKELAGKIVKDVSLYNKKISQATVTVIGFLSRQVYV
jgi:polysaccharide export outer membrane protein